MTEQHARERAKSPAPAETHPHFRLLAEAIPQIVWTANPDGSVDYFNQRWTDYTGMTLEEAQGWGWQPILHPDDLQASLDRWNEALRTGESYEIEYRFKRASDGAYRWQLGRALPMRDESGRIVKWFGTCTDIEDQKRSEELLREARIELERLAKDRTKELDKTNLLLKDEIAERERIDQDRLEQAKILASILDNMGDAVIVADRDENLLVFNPTAERMFGDGATATRPGKGSDQYGVFLPDKVTPFPADQLPLVRSSRGEQIDDVEMFVRHAKAPKGIWTRVSGRPLSDGLGGSLGAVIVCRDITERKQEEAFRAGQSELLEMIARAEPLESVLKQLMLLIEAQADEMFCSILLLAEDGKHVRHGAAPSLPTDYVRAVDGAPIGPKNGSCGTAMYLAKPVIVTDIFTDPLWEDYRGLAAASGLRACWSTPIFSGSGKVLGSFAMYYRTPQTPSGSEAKLTEVATHIAGIAIEHQRAEEELRASEERFAKAFNANPNPMSLATLEEGRIIEVNESFVELSGYARPELIGRNSLDLIWEMPLSRDALIQRVKERGLVSNIETRIRTKSGDARLLLVSTLIVDIGGQDCLLSVSNDITERRRAEEQVGLLQAITMDVAAAPDLKAALEVVLRRVCESTGWVLGQAWVPGKDQILECSSAWFTTVEGLEEFRLGSEHTRLPMGVGLPGRVWKLKRPAWVRDVTLDDNFPRAHVARESGLKAALALPILSGNEVIAVIEFFLRERRDEDERLVKVITAVAAQLDMAIERKRAEEALRSTQAELAHVSRLTTMGELAASIAHEVNQPLGAIVGNADICLNWLSKDGPDLKKLAEALEDISSDGRRASEVIDRIRTMVKKKAPQKTMLDLNELALESQQLVAHEAHRKGVALKTELGDALPLVSGDRVQLQQVMLNLMMNGMDAMADVERQSRQLTVITTHDGRTALVAVRDSGIGIEPHDSDQIFKAFHTTKSGGMGMGLAISRSIVEAHGGRLWLERNQGPGVTFKFLLPAGGEAAG